MSKRFAALCTIVACLTFAATTYAQIKYVKICSIYGDGFYYIPFAGESDEEPEETATDIGVCFRPSTGDTRVQTAGGTWRLFQTESGAWVKSPRAGCRRGRVVHLGTIGPEDLTMNLHQRQETGRFPLTLAADEFVSNVMMHGGFSAAPDGTFCVSFWALFDLGFGDGPKPVYESLGCKNTAPLRSQPGWWAITPVRTTPSEIFASPVQLIGHVGAFPWETTPPIEGELSLAVCVQHLPR
jgi:hypothetical protein